MKKWIILFGALLAASMVLVYCTKVEFDNPLDEKGSNFLYGDSSDRDKKIAENDDGVSNIFNTSENKDWLCDTKLPKLEVLGGASVTIYTNNQAELNRLMGEASGVRWNNVVTVSWQGKEGEINARFTRNGETDVPYSVNVMPEPGLYVIVYTAKTPVCNDKVLSDTKVRLLEILEYIPEDKRPPIIRFTTGEWTVSLTIGENYKDPGVTAYDGDAKTEIPLTSIVVKDSRGTALISVSSKGTTSAMLSDLESQMKGLSEREATYTVTYNVTSPTNQYTAYADRIVEFKPQSTAGQPIPVIVLNTYRHVIEGKTIESTDTAFVSGRGVYAEKGVKEAYYMKDGAKIPISTDLVQRPTVASSQNPLQRTATYTLAASPGNYQAGAVARYVYIWDGECEENFTPPEISWTSGGDEYTLQVSDGTWDFSGSWRVTGKDETAASLQRKYLVDLGGMERVIPPGQSSYHAALKAGTYTVTYVALGGCGRTTVKTRTVTVR